MDNILITTTVSLDCDAEQPMQTLHLVQGDYGTRALRFIPVLNGRLMDMEAAGVERVKVRLHCDGREDLLLDCVMSADKRYADLVPTQAMVDEADEWAAQLVLLDEENHTVSSAPFRVMVHGTVYEGDAVEHTNSAVLSAYYDAQGNLNIEKLNGETVRSTGEENLIAKIQEELADHLVSDEDRQALEDLDNNINQPVKTTDSPTFAGLTIGSLIIHDDGTIEGAKFA